MVKASRFVHFPRRATTLRKPSPTNIMAYVWGSGTVVTLHEVTAWSVDPAPVAALKPTVMVEPKSDDKSNVPLALRLKEPEL